MNIVCVVTEGAYICPLTTPFLALLKEDNHLQKVRACVYVWGLLIP